MALVVLVFAAVLLVAFLSWAVAQVAVLSLAAIAVAAAKEIVGYRYLGLRFALYALCLVLLYRTYDGASFLIVALLAVVDLAATLLQLPLPARAILVATCTLLVPIKDIAFAHAAFESEGIVTEVIPTSSFQDETFIAGRSKEATPYVVRVLLSALAACLLVSIGFGTSRDRDEDFVAGLVVAALVVIGAAFVIDGAKDGACRGAMSVCLQDLGFDRTWWPAINPEDRIK